MDLIATRKSNGKKDEKGKEGYLRKIECLQTGLPSGRGKKASLRGLFLLPILLRFALPNMFKKKKEEKPGDEKKKTRMTILPKPPSSGLRPPSPTENSGGKACVPDSYLRRGTFYVVHSVTSQ